MKRGIAVFLGLLALSACKKTKTEQGVLVNLTNPSGIAGIVQLRVSLSNHGSTNTLLFPPNQPKALIAFPTSFSLAVAAPRNGQVDLVVEALNASMLVVASASTSVALESNRFVSAPMVLLPGPFLCGNGKLDQGEPCDDGNHFSGDRCDFMCRGESVQDAAMPVDGAMPVDSDRDTGGRLDVDRPGTDLGLVVDVDSVRTDSDSSRDLPIGTGGIAIGGTGGAAGSTGTRPADAAVTSGNVGTGGVVTTGGSVGTGGMIGTGGSGLGGSGTGGAIAAGGAIATGGTKATGGSTSGTGGVFATGGSVGTGGAGTGLTGGAFATGGMIGMGGSIGIGGIAAFDPTWAQWPMPNSQVDVTAGTPNLASYTDNGNGTVTDNVTGLMWQQAMASDTYTWEQAKAYCPTLTLGGYGDWRLPSRIELVSIVDFGRRDPAIDTTYSPATPSSWFWSSSPKAGSPSYAWPIYFLDGQTNGGVVSAAGYVRCVR